MYLIVAFHCLPTIASLTSARNFVSRDAGTILLDIARVMFVLIHFVKRRNLPREAAGLRIPGLVRCALVRVEAVYRHVVFHLPMRAHASTGRKCWDGTS